MVPPPPPPPISLLRTAPAAITAFVRRLPSTARYLWNEQRQWLWMLLPLIVALLPTLRGIKTFWLADDGPLWFQPFVPILSGLLIWERRDEWQPLYQFQQEQFAPDSKNRRGYLFPVIVSCLILVLGSITSTFAVSVAGLVLVSISTFYYLYGFAMLRALWIPLAYLFVMIPPPLGLLAMASGKLQQTTLKVLEVLLRPIEGSITNVGNGLLTASSTIPVSFADGGRGVILPVLVLSLWIAIRRRISVFAALIVFVVAIIVSFVLNLIRVWAFGKLGVHPSLPMTGIVNLFITGLVLFPVSRVARKLAQVGSRGGIQMYPMQ